MNERLAKAEAIFHEALERPPEQRETFLQQGCGEDAELLREITALLRASGIADHWLKDTDCAAAQPSLASPLLDSLSEGPGTVVGRYKLLEKIGEGGFGVVYMAEQKEPVRRKVALKIIKLGMDTKSVIARFEAERQALALMDHPNIAKVFDAGAVDAGVESQISNFKFQIHPGRPYFVMELVRGVPMTRFCQENQLSTTERLELFIQVCGAIQHAHQKGIIHRDIKPSNVLVALPEDGGLGTEDGGQRAEDREPQRAQRSQRSSGSLRLVPSPKVIDFGVAKAINQRLTEKTLFTNFAQMIGTPAYMSPEQAEMSKLDVDTRSDVYSLGVLLYELLTGTTPFSEERLRSTGYAGMQRIICEEEPEKPSTKITKVRRVTDARSTFPKSQIANPKSPIDKDLDWIVMKCLEKDRNRRYETANELAADLKRHLDNEPVLARPPSLAYRLQKSVRRNKLAFLAAAAIAVVLMAASIFSTWQAVRAKTAEALAEARAAEVSRASAETEAINNWLVNDLLQQADPRRGGELGSAAKTITLDQAILKASASLEDRFANQPATEAYIRGVIGRALGNLGETKAGIENLRRAYELFNQHWGATHTNTLRAQRTLGWFLAFNYSYKSGNKSERELGEEGRRHLEECYRLELQTFGPNDEMTLGSAFALGVAYKNADDVKLADGIISDAFETVQRMVRTNAATSTDMQLWAVQSMFALRVGQGRHSEAYQLQKQRLILMEKHAQANPAAVPSAETASCYARLGLYARSMDRDNAKAESLLKRGLEISRVTTGDGWPTGNILSWLADLCREEGRTAEAAGYAREGLEIDIRRVGVAHSATRTNGRYVASIFGDLADWPDVIAELRNQRDRGITDATSLAQELLASHLAGETHRLPALHQFFWDRYQKDPTEEARYYVALSLLVLPRTTAELPDILNLAKRAESDEGEGAWGRWRKPTLEGLSAFRGEHLAESIRILEPVAHNLHNRRLAALARYFVAMGLHQQGKTSAARDELEQANHLFDRLLRTGNLNPAFPGYESWTTCACLIIAREEAEKLIGGKLVSAPVTQESLASAKAAWKPVHDLMDEAFETARRQDYISARDLILQAQKLPAYDLEAAFEDFEWVIEWVPVIFAQAGDEKGFVNFLREAFREEGNLPVNYVMPAAYARGELPADLRKRIEVSTAVLAKTNLESPIYGEGEVHRYWDFRHVGMVLYRLGETGRALEMLATATKDQYHDCSVSAKAYASLAAWKEGRHEEARKWRVQAEEGFRTRAAAGQGVLGRRWWHLAATDLALKEARELMGDSSSRE
jgi:serine/threonine protein kinase